jgi:phosphoglycolate phosphatase
MPEIKGVILDFDDTLCLTEQACFDLENEILVALGREPMSRDIHKQTWGLPLFEAIEMRSPGVNVADFRNLFSDKLRQAIDAGEMDKIPEENLAAIDRLVELGKTVLLLTSREKAELEHIMDPEHLLAPRIEAFYYKDNMQFHKPDPRAFDHIEREHGWKPEECVYVGDSVGDAAAAKQAGLHFIASLESGLRTREDFSDYPVDAYISHFTEVVDAVADIEKKED